MGVAGAGVPGPPAHRAFPCAASARAALSPSPFGLPLPIRLQSPTIFVTFSSFTQGDDPAYPCDRWPPPVPPASPAIENRHGRHQTFGQCRHHFRRTSKRPGCSTCQDHQLIQLVNSFVAARNMSMSLAQPEEGLHPRGIIKADHGPRHAHRPRRHHPAGEPGGPRPAGAPAGPAPSA